MKGPGGRLRFDIRRLWECPVCHRRELTAGDVVARLCTCSAKTDPPRQVWMKLIETKPARPAPIPQPTPPGEPGAATSPPEPAAIEPAAVSVAAQPGPAPSTEGPPERNEG